MKLQTLLSTAAIAVSSLAAANTPGEWSRIYLGSSPSVSPDGSFFLFGWCDRIWRASADGGVATPLNDGLSRDWRPIVSPDGRKAAFMSDREGYPALFELDLASGARRQVTFHTEGLEPWGYTADGKSMLAAANRDAAADGEASLRFCPRPVFISMETRSAEKTIFEAPLRDPALSPDGKKILFVDRGEMPSICWRKRAKGNWSSATGDIWLYDSGKADKSDPGKAFTPVATGREDDRFPVWARDGKSFYYLNDSAGCRNVHRRSLETGEDRAITKFTDNHVRSYSISADGRTMIACQGFDFWRLDPEAESPAPQRIILRPAGFDPSANTAMRVSSDKAGSVESNADIAFSPDGSQIAFIACDALWVMDSTGKRPVCVDGSDLSAACSCTFSPDEEILYYLADCGERTDVCAARRADPSRTWSENSSFRLERLSKDDSGKSLLSVSPDGSKLAWTGKTGEFRIADTNGCVKYMPQTPTQGCAEYVWSPDSRWIAATLGDDTGNRDVWIVPAHGGDGKTPDPQPYNVSRNYKSDGSPAWSPDGKILAFSGLRAMNGGARTILYAYLDPDDEYADMPDPSFPHEKKKDKAKKAGAAKDGVEKDGAKTQDENDSAAEECGDKDGGKGKTGLKNGGEAKPRPETKIAFDGLADRVRMAKVDGRNLLFASDSRTLAFNSGKSTFTVKLPGDLKPVKIFDECVIPIAWPGKPDKKRLLGASASLPFRDGKRVEFKVCKERNVADWQELVCMKAWGELRDRFCDTAMHGADWAAVKEKYRHALRNAPHWSVGRDVLNLIVGELDSSHLGFKPANTPPAAWNRRVRRDAWTPVTAHIGARFDPSHKGRGWLVRDIATGSSADCGRRGLMPGDTVVSIDGREVNPDMDYAEAMNVPMPHDFRIVFERGGERREIELKAMTYAEIRKLLRNDEIRAVRDYVHSKGNYGYINIEAMVEPHLSRFMDEIHAEGHGRDGIIIDVRYNHGGNIADRVLDVLCSPQHSRSRFRGNTGDSYLMSYRGRPPLSNLPAVVLCGHESSSNAEIFSHAFKEFKRGKLVGETTGGKVIATSDVPLLDYGTLRRAHIGWFKMDGKDMENNGAVPDIEIPLTPADTAAGRDPQLEAALDALKGEIAARKPLPPLEYAPANRPGAEKRK